MPPWPHTGQGCGHRGSAGSWVTDTLSVFPSSPRQLAPRTLWDPEEGRCCSLLAPVRLDGRTTAWLQVAGGRTNVSSSEIRGERRMGQGGVRGFEVCSREAGSRTSSYTDRPPLESRRGQEETAGTERHSDCVLGASWVQPLSLEHSFPLTGAAVALVTSPTCRPPASTSSGPLQRRKSSKWTSCWLCPRRATPSVHSDRNGCWRSAIPVWVPRMPAR